MMYYFDANINEYSSKQMVLEGIKGNLWELEFANEKWKDDDEVAVAAIKRNWVGLKYMSERIRSDKRFVKLAMQSNCAALNYATESLRSDERMLGFYVQQLEAQSERKYNIDFRINNSVECLEKLEALIGNKILMPLLSDRDLDDKELMMKKVLENCWLIFFVSARLANDEELVMRAMEIDLSMFGGASKRIREEYECWNSEVEILAAMKESLFKSRSSDLLLKVSEVLTLEVTPLQQKTVKL